MSRNRSVEEVCIETQIDGREVAIEFDRVTYWVRDRHYGADADGNRGEDVTYIDEELAEQIVVSIDGVDRNGDDVLIYTPYIDLDELIQLAVNRAIDEYMQRVEPTAPEETEPEYEPE